ncbi:MAG: class I SAM-dependent methyltransferase [Flavobacteriales bacterium]
MAGRVTPYTREPLNHLCFNEVEIPSFLTREETNLDLKTVQSFGEEWIKFNSFTEEELTRAGDEYFDIVPSGLLNENTTVLDAGCGTGRWSRYMSRFGCPIEAIDPSEAIIPAVKWNKDKPTIRFTHASIDSMPFTDNSFDFVICLGVLHHIPDTEKALQDLVKKIKPGGHLLLYLYYSLDNRGWAFRAIFGLVNFKRKMVSKLPGKLKRLVCDLIAIFVYLPLVLLSKFFGIFSEKLANKIPLSYYRNKSWRIIRNDALDRFGTPLEHRFSQQQIAEMLQRARMDKIIFSENTPYWHVISRKK